MRIQISTGPIDPAVLYGMAVKWGVREAPPARTPTEPELRELTTDLAEHMRKQAEAAKIADVIACDCGRRFPDLAELQLCPYCGETITIEGEGPPAQAAPEPPKEAKKKAAKEAKNGSANGSAHPTQKDIAPESQAVAGTSESNARVTPTLTTPAVEVERDWQFIREQSRTGAAAFWQVGARLMEMKRAGRFGADPLFAECKTIEALIERRTGWQKQHAYRAMQLANTVTLEQIEQHTAIGVEGWSLIAREVAQLPEGEPRRAAAGEAAQAAASGARGKRGPKREAVKKAARAAAEARGAKPKREVEPKPKKDPKKILGELPGLVPVEDKRFDLSGTINSQYALPYHHPKTGAELSRPRDLVGLYVELKLGGGHVLVVHLGKSLAEVAVCRRSPK